MIFSFFLWWRSFTVPGTKVAPFPQLLWGVNYHCLVYFSGDEVSTKSAALRRVYLDSLSAHYKFLLGVNVWNAWTDMTLAVRLYASTLSFLCTLSQ